jgi:hypothetical protein
MKFNKTQTFQHHIMCHKIQLPYTTSQKKKSHNLANNTPITRAKGHVLTHQTKKIFGIRP